MLAGESVPWLPHHAEVDWQDIIISVLRAPTKGYHPLTLVVCIAAARVKQNHALGIPVDLHVSGPDVSVDEDRLDAPASCLERAQQSRNDLFEELMADFVHFRVWPPDALFPCNVGSKLATKELLPGIAPLVDQGYDAIECGDVEAKLSSRGHRSLVQLFEDFDQLCWLGSLVAEITKWRKEK